MGEWWWWWCFRWCCEGGGASYGDGEALFGALFGGVLGDDVGGRWAYLDGLALFGMPAGMGGHRTWAAGSMSLNDHGERERGRGV